MAGYRFLSSVSGKVLLSMIAVSVAIGIAGVAVFWRLSDRTMANAAAERDRHWADCISTVTEMVATAEAPADLDRAITHLQRKYAFIKKIAVLDSEGRPLASFPPSFGAPRGDRDDGEEKIASASAESDREDIVSIPLSGRDDASARTVRFAFDSDAYVFDLGGFRWRVVGVVAFALVGAFVLFSFLFSYLVKRPVRQMLMASRALASNAGDLTGSISIVSDDEIGHLGETLNEIFTNLSEIIRLIRTTSDKVNFSAQSLSASTEEMNSITEETSMTVQNIARSTDLQAHKVEEMIKEIKNMERSVKQVANSAELAASAATNASETATKGGDSAKEAVEKINKIYDVINESAAIARVSFPK